jgi:hypothetical protein
MSTKLLRITLLLLVCSAPVFAQQTQEYGPAKGTLLIVGGGALEGTGIQGKFIQLAGGRDKKFVLSAGDVYNMKTRKIEKLGFGSSN